MGGTARKPPALVVAGPTCSGKSALASDIAEAVGGTVINADSMQVYRELRVLTARPTPEEEARVPHALYGVRPAAEPSSVGWWRDAALAAMRAAQVTGRLPILCGGTGLYLASLAGGLADIPDPGPEAREEARSLLAAEGVAVLHARLASVDPATAARLRPTDSQRVARAWEVWRGTGTGLAAWQAGPPTPVPELAWSLHAVLLDPPRDVLRAAIASRFDAMLSGGALDEVARLLALRLEPALPAMRAHGVPELAAHLRGELDLAEAVLRACTATGQYTKRQATWFRHRSIAAAAQTHGFIARYAGKTKYYDAEQPEIVNFICVKIDAARLAI